MDQVCLSFFLLFFYLFPFNFIHAEERNTNLDKNIKNWILVIFGTCIIQKLTASCLRLSFHLTFKFLVLQTNHQYFLFFVLKCRTKIQSGRSHADFSTLKSEDLTTKSWCVFSKHLDILTSCLFLILVTSLHKIVVMFIERN